MKLDPNTTTVHEVQAKKYDQRFICQADMSKYSVELVVQVDEDTDQGVLTIWDEKDLIANNRVVDVDVSVKDEKGVNEFFENFLIGDVNNYLR